MVSEVTAQHSSNEASDELSPIAGTKDIDSSWSKREELRIKHQSVRRKLLFILLPVGAAIGLAAVMILASIVDTSTFTDESPSKKLVVLDVVLVVLFILALVMYFLVDDKMRRDRAMLAIEAETQKAFG